MTATQEKAGARLYKETLAHYQMICPSGRGKGYEMNNSKAMQGAYDCYRDEVESLEEEYAAGKVSIEEYDRMMYNLSHNLNSEIRELKGETL